MNNLLEYSVVFGLCIFLAISCDKEKKEVTCSILHGSVVDSRDGNMYPTVSICNQTWLSQNLRYKGNDALENKANPGYEYGLLYTHEQAKEACLDGWHLPTDKDWKILEMALGLSEKDTDKSGWRGEKEGRYLKATTGWVHNGNNSNSSGFRALPAGYYNSKKYIDLGIEAKFWTATENDNNQAWGRSMNGDRKKINRFSENKTTAFSCRCLKDD